MHSSPSDDRKTSNDLGPLLRYWRGARGKSQLDVSLDTEISQRQISFIESGRSTPQRESLLRIADALNVPLRERNTLLLAAGYAPVYASAGLDDPDMKPVRRALERALVQHEPFPAFVMDRYWNVLLANAASPRFFGLFTDLSRRPEPRNLLHLMFDPQGMRPFIVNWPHAARSLLARVFREAVGHVIDAKTKTLLRELSAYPDVDADWRFASTTMEDSPVIPLSFAKNGRTFRFFSLVSTVGTAQTIATQELRLECMYPADDETEENYRDLMDTRPVITGNDAAGG
jgi:transcriptional regulator with XRE-family HTH domain